jgi:hypothetical protein
VAGVTILTADEVMADADESEISVGIDGETVLMPTLVRCAIGDSGAVAADAAWRLAHVAKALADRPRPYEVTTDAVPAPDRAAGQGQPKRSIPR